MAKHGKQKSEKVPVERATGTRERDKALEMALSAIE